MTAVYIRNAGRSSLYEQEFREKLRTDFAQRQADLETLPIRHITMVGVARPIGFGFNGGDEDSLRLRVMMNYLAQKGTVIDPDFEIDAVDFMLGRDYLKETTSTDLVFVSCLPKDQESLQDLSMVQNVPCIDDRALHDLKQNGRHADVSQAFALASALSNRHNALNWQTRLKQSNARLCVTFGGQAEISTQFLNNDAYDVTIPTPNRLIRGWKTPHEGADEFYGYKNDYPMLWLGMLAKKPKFL